MQTQNELAEKNMRLVGLHISLTLLILIFIQTVVTYTVVNSIITE